MLRARTLQERGNSYICAFCRHKLAPRPGQLQNGCSPTATRTIISNETPRPSIALAPQSFGVRSFSTSSALCEPKNDSKPGGFPGGGFGGAVGGFGGFGGFGQKDTGTPSNKPAQSHELLPHEVEARQRMGLAPKKPTPKKQQAATPNKPPNDDRTLGKSKKGKGVKGKKNDRNNQGNSHAKTASPPKEAPASVPAPASSQALIQAQQQQSQLASHVLAQAFKTDRAPRPVATPSSWSGSGSSQPSQPSPPSWGSFSSRKVDTEVPLVGRVRATSIAPKLPPDAAPKEVKERVVYSGEKAWGQLKKSSRRQDQQNKAEKKKTDGDDFWNALEDRVASYGDKKKADQAARIESLGSMDGSEILTRPSGSSLTNNPRSRDRPRREERYAIEEESAGQSQVSKKDKRRQQRWSKDMDDEWDEQETSRFDARQRRKADKETRRREKLEREIPQITLPEFISVSNLARALGVTPHAFLADLEQMGFEDLTEDTIMTGDTGALVAQEYGFDPIVESGADRDLRPRPIPEDPSSLPARPPVVTIMGHVDHGKTTLLDWLRKSSIAAGEHGGITQHIGAFVVQMSSGKQITFLDTPGHAAFLSMRQRGANVTDIVVLVVAADDSVMPQTIEALKHATAAKVPIIVAINKIDKEDARIEQVKADLARHGVEIEDYGGDVQVVPVSGRTGKGMQDLEENIVTLSEVLDVRAETDGMSEGWILESSLKPTGKVASVLVKRGTLRLGDYIVAGKTWARIRTLKNEAGIEILEAPPGTPVEILGWRDLPEAGEQVLQAPDETKAKTAVEYRQEMADREESSLQLAQQEQREREKAAAEEAAAQAEAGIEVAVPEDTKPSILYRNFIVKADVNGSVEAVCGTVQEIGNNEVHAKILRSSVGPISEYDVDHAAASNSVIINFNNPILPHIQQRAKEAGVRVIDHSVIYHVADEVRDAVADLLPEDLSHRVLGEADIIQVFAINVKKRVTKNIAGCKIRNGSVKRSSRVKIIRRGEVVFDGKIDTLKHVKKDVQEMGKGTECGIGLENFQDFQIDDQIQTYEEISKKRTL